MPEVLVGSFVTAFMIPLTLAGLAFAYLGLRIRDARADMPDPELGLKSAFHAFLTAGILLALTGGTIAVIDLLGDALEGKPNKVPPPQFNPGPGRVAPPPPRMQQDNVFDSVSQRVAWPLVISGCLFALVSLLLVKAATNDARYPSVRRAFSGIRVVASGLNVMVGTTVLIEFLFQKEMENLRPISVGVGLIGIWLPAGCINLITLKRDSKLPYFVPPKPKKGKRWEEEEDHDRDGDRGRNKDRADERDRDDDRPEKRRRPEKRKDRDDDEE